MSDYLVTFTPGNAIFPHGAYTVWSSLAIAASAEDAEAIIAADKGITTGIVKQRVEGTELSVIKGGIKDD